MRQSRRIPVSVCLALLVMTVACRGNRDSGTTGTTGSTAVRVTDVTLRRSVGGDKSITDRTDTFRPNDTIHRRTMTPPAPMGFARANSSAVTRPVLEAHP
jgi:hypothetical protein